jgi:LacI family transcriptional regulator
LGLKMAATIKDVALAAGVSFKTVSRVLNNDAAVADETRARVHEALEKLDYRVHQNARQLRTKTSNTIGLVTDEIITTPHAVRIIRGAQQVAWTHEKLLLTVNTERNEAVEAEAIDRLLERGVDGIIYATMFHREVVIPDALRSVPTVLLDCFERQGAFPSVIPDEFQGGYLATETLLARGHTRVGLINVDNPFAGEKRFAGYVAAHRAANVAVDLSLVKVGNSMADMGHTLTLELMQHDRPPSALFCGNDRTAMGAYNALADLGLRIPDDVAVVGFDNEELIAAYLRPALTTVALPHFEMGAWAVNKLMDKGKGEVAPHLLECPLVQRESV